MIAIIYIIAQLIYRTVFKLDKSMALCGLSGFNAVKGITPAQAKLVTLKMKILGLANQSRGTDSCGMYINGKVHKGWDDMPMGQETAKFIDFMGNDNFMVPDFNPKLGSTILIHTRAATKGVKNEENAHPFFIKSVHGEAEDLWGTHNGTITDIDDLARANGLPYTYGMLDSRVLYQLIDKEGYKILSEYSSHNNGGAALLWTKPAEPNSMYVFVGASYTSYKDQKENKIYYERPLFYLRAEEGIYVSSLENSLLAIRNNDKEKVQSVRANTVFKVTNGVQIKEVAVIERAEMGLPKVYVNPNFSRGSEYSVEDSYDFATPTESLVWAESVPKRALKGRIYYRCGRYWNSKGELLNGQLFLSKKGDIEKESSYTSEFWFFRGVMLEDTECFKKLRELEDIKYSWVHAEASNGTTFAFDISRYSRYPVTCLPGENTKIYPYTRFAWYNKGMRVQALKFNAAFSSRTYHIVHAYLRSITTCDKLADGSPFITVQNDLPWEKIGKDDENVFDAILPSVEEAFKMFDYVEMLAVAAFIKSKIESVYTKNTWKAADINAEIRIQIGEAVREKQSIRSILKDNHGALDMLVEMIQAEKEKLGDDKFFAQYGYNDIPDIGEALLKLEDDVEEADLNELDQIKEKQEKDLDMAVTKMEDIVGLLSELQENAIELDAGDANYGKECATALMQAVENLRHKLSEISDDYSVKEIPALLNSKLNVTV